MTIDEIYALYVTFKQRNRERMLSLVKTAESVETINRHTQPLRRVDFERYWSVITEAKRQEHTDAWTTDDHVVDANK